MTAERASQLPSRAGCLSAARAACGIEQQHGIGHVRTGPRSVFETIGRQFVQDGAIKLTSSVWRQLAIFLPEAPRKDDVHIQARAQRGSCRHGVHAGLPSGHNRQARLGVDLAMQVQRVLTVGHLPRRN